MHQESLCLHHLNFLMAFSLKVLAANCCLLLPSELQAIIKVTCLEVIYLQHGSPVPTAGQGGALTVETREAWASLTSLSNIIMWYWKCYYLHYSKHSKPQGSRKPFHQATNQCRSRRQPSLWRPVKPGLEENGLSMAGGETIPESSME